MKKMLKRSLALLLCLVMLLPTFTAFATSQSDVAVAASSTQESADRWEFFKYDFSSWDARPITNMEKNNYVTFPGDWAQMRSGDNNYANIELWKGKSSLQITGKHSFQFDFCFNRDSASNAVWFRPFYNSRSSLKVTVTQDKVAFYNGSYSPGCNAGYTEGDDVLVGSEGALDLNAGTWYTVRCEKDGADLRVKVWETGVSEPDNWQASVVDTNTNDNGTDFVGFFIRYMASKNDTMYLDNFVMYKETNMTVPDTVNVGMNDGNNPVEVEATFTPDIYAAYPTPPAVQFAVSDSTVADLTSVDSTTTSLFAKKLTTDGENVTLTATMGDFTAVSNVQVVDIIPETTTEIGNRLELFVDHELVDMEGEANGISKDVTFVMHEPELDEVSEHPFPSGGHYITVIYDEALDIYRGYYRVDADGQHYCYVESTDGINWYQLDLDICDQHSDPNVIMCSHITDNVQKFEHNFSPFLDTSVPVGHAERYKAMAGYISDDEYDTGETNGKGLYTLVSPDGIHWSRKSNAPVILFNKDLHERAFDSQNVAFWSEEEQQYVCYYRHYVTPAGTSYRSVARATSKDFVTWTDEISEFIVPNLNGGTEQLYTSQTAPYFRAPHIYIATAARYGLGNVVGIDPDTGENYTVEDAIADNQGATDVMLMTSRAGYNKYIRQFEEAFLRPGIDISGWTDRRNYPSLNLVPVGEKEMSFYNLNGHRYVLRTDGFVSAHAGVEGGELLTKPVIFSNPEDLALLVNISTSVTGSLRVELQDQFGEPISGFERENCVPMTGDWIEKAVVWNGHDVSELAGREVKVCFVMDDCDLYSYKFDTPQYADLDRIEVDFEQGNKVVYADTTLEELSSVITVNAVMTDGTKNVLHYGDYSMKGLLTSGIRTITVYYGGMTASFRIEVTKAEPASISAVFNKGSMRGNLTLSELKELLTVTGINDDGSEFVIYPQAYTLTGKSTPGGMVTVTYKGLTTSLKVPGAIPVSTSKERNLSIIDTTYVKTEAGAAATNISDRLELFVDGSLVESMTDVSYKQHAPQKAAASENPFPAGSAYTTVIYDEEAKLYRGYYRDERLDAYRYAESTDGINWYLPELGIYTHYTEPNVILAANDKYNVQNFENNFSPFLDTNPSCDPAERYKAVAGYIPALDYSSGDAEGKGLYTLVSPDGIHWSRKSNAPVIVYDEELHYRAFESQNVVFWSEAEQQYICYFRYFNNQNQGSKVYTVGRATSKDFITWTDESAEFAKPNLTGEHLHNNQTAPYFRAPHIYIATATRYAASSATDIMLMSSRAGSMSYDRQFTEAFMKAGVDKAGWTDRYNYLSLNAVPTGYREMSFYHQSGDRYTLRTDGFASVHADAKGGELVTEPVVFSGNELVLNFSTSVKGAIRVELQQLDDTPYAGFEEDKCVELNGDSIAKAVSWNNANVESLIGKPVKIRFILKDCDLYSYRFRSADEAKLSGISATFQQNSQPIYAHGSCEQLVPMLKVIATYTDGTQREIPRDGYGIHSSMNAGNPTVTIYHETESASFTANVTVNPETGSIAPEQPELGEPVAEKFTDVRTGNKYYDAVEYVTSNGLVSAVTNTRFGLNYAAYRATVVTALWRMENEPWAEDEMTFEDVSKGEWYTEAVRWAAANNIINGISETKFSPMAEITKENLLTLLYRYAKYKNYDVSVGSDLTLEFADASEISSYAVEAVKWACGVGIITNEEAELAPKTAVIRGDFAQFIKNFCEIEIP